MSGGVETQMLIQSQTSSATELQQGYQQNTLVSPSLSLQNRGDEKTPEPVDVFGRLFSKLKKKAAEDRERRKAVELGEPDRNKYVHHAEPSKLFASRNDSDEVQPIWVYTANANNRKLLFDGKIQNIHSILLREDTFEAAFKFYLTWLATDDDVTSFIETPKGKEKEWKPKWTPKMDLTNADARSALSKPQYKLRHGAQYDWEEIWMKQVFDPTHALWVRAEYNVKGKFIEEYELQSFPFDTQDLNIHIKHKGNYKDHVVFAPFPRDGPYLNFNTHLSELQDYLVTNMLVEFGTTKKNKSKRGDTFPAMVVCIKLTRRYRSQLSKLFLVMAIAGMSVGVFTIDRANTGERLNYLITLILTDVALQQSIRDKLDDFPYETYMDKVILLGFGLKIVVMIWVMIAARIDNASVDGFVAFGAVAVLILYYLFTVLYAWILHTYEISKLSMSAGELETALEQQDPATAPVQVILKHTDDILSCEADYQLAVFGYQLPNEHLKESELKKMFLGSN